MNHTYNGVKREDDDKKQMSEKFCPGGQRGSTVAADPEIVIPCSGLISWCIFWTVTTKYTKANMHEIEVQLKILFSIVIALERCFWG